MTLDVTKRLMIDDLLAKSTMLVDSMKLHEWLQLFEPEAKYMVIPSENRIHGYPAAIINCQSRAILQDRIAVLFRASKYNPHVDRHILSRTCIVAEADGVVTCHTNFAIMQSTLEGFSKLFCTGVYEDEIRLTTEGAMFRQRIAVLDTFSVPNLIATPI
jgi:anthranilate 1,2-dioxygenase small subunit